MSAEYKLRVYDASGVAQAELTDFLALSYAKQVNSPGVLKVQLDGAHSIVPALALNWQVEVWRRNTQFGIPWYADFYGFYRSPKRSTDAGGQDYFELMAPGQMAMLDWRIIAWYANTANRSLFASAKAETVLKTLVDYNAGPHALASNGRLRDGAITGLSIQADGANGSTIDLGCAWVNLLTQLQAICGKGSVVSGGDFDLVKTGAATWEFRWYTGQLGTDRSASVIFSTDFGNMGSPVWEQDRSSEATVAIAGGKGVDSARLVAVRTGADYAVATDNIEVFVDATTEATTAGLNAKGDVALDKLRARPAFSFDVIQTEACMYGLHYFLGDKASARYGPVSATMKIDSVSVDFSPAGSETIKVGMVNP